MVLESGLVHEAEDHYVLTGQLPLWRFLPRCRTLSWPAWIGLARRDRWPNSAPRWDEFSYEVIQAVAPLDEVVLQHELAQLVAAELVYQHGLPPQARYLFKHTLIQETAYHLLLKSTRQRHHQRIAGAGGTVSRDRAGATRTAGPSLHRGRSA